MENVGISKLDLKRQNRRQILRLLRNAGPTSRIDIAHTIHITKAAVTIITNEMIREGILQEIGEQAPTGGKVPRGRKKILLDYNPTWRLVLGVSVQGEWLDVGLCTLRGETVEHHALMIDPSTTFQKLVQMVGEVYHDLAYKNDLKPEMSAPMVCEKLVEAIKSGKYDVIIINFANPDMVGHTGVEAAAVKAIETVDECVGRAVEAIKEVDGQMFICADHGNAEQLVDYETGAPFTAHTTNPVPFILVNADPSYTLREGGRLADIVPTLIELMGMEQPEEMTGKSLLVKKA